MKFAALWSQWENNNLLEIFARISLKPKSTLPGDAHTTSRARPPSTPSCPQAAPERIVSKFSCQLLPVVFAQPNQFDSISKLGPHFGLGWEREYTPRICMNTIAFGNRGSLNITFCAANKARVFYDIQCDKVNSMHNELKELKFISANSL